MGPYKRGREAYVTGYLLDQNPYPARSVGAMRWRAGWLEARNEERD